jgi:hypothetical protein
MIVLGSPRPGDRRLNLTPMDAKKKPLDRHLDCRSSLAGGWTRFFFFCQFPQHGQSLQYGFAADVGAADVAVLTIMCDDPATARSSTEKDKANGFSRHSACGSGDASYGDSEIDGRMGEGTFGHLFGAFAADRAIYINGCGSHTQHLLFCFIRICDEAAVEHCR